MSQVIRISDDLYKRLEAHASGFDTPSNVIETILNAYEGNNTVVEPNDPSELSPAEAMEIVYVDSTNIDFKTCLLDSKKAFVRISYTDNSSEIKEWNASRFSSESSVEGNLRSGYLRGWRERGICKAELATSKEKFA